MKVKIILRQATPALIGYYKPDKIDEAWYLRPSSLKGVWRWFMRALVAGALYDLGYLHGCRGRSIVLKPTRSEVMAVSYIVGKVFGMGYADPEGKESEVSRIRMLVKPLKSPRVDKASNILGESLQRLRLLSRSRKGIDPFCFCDGEFKVTLLVSKRQGAEEVAIKALPLALTLSGLGKGARRALGSFDVLDIEMEHLSLPERLPKLLNELHESVKEEIEQRSNRLEKFGLKRSAEAGRVDLPPMPLLSKAMPARHPASEIYLARGPRLRWQQLHNFFLRSYRCQVLYGNSKAQDTLRRKLEAWVLGLPREQRKQNTGYRAKGVARRASPILVAYHTKEHIYGDGAYITSFLSLDWPSQIEWRDSIRRQRTCQLIPVNQGRVVSALSDAIDELKRYLSRCGARVHRIWP
ncbi:MAG: hypothetical protein DRJ67_09250 [Thermoprotei archaeon]|nr:MAG: hypothetical protein DRJ67_09250 [Thermoprotei archaeon]